MNEFYGGIIAGIGMLGGLCAFIYWVFSLMEKRMEMKMEKLSDDIHTIAMDLKEERRNQTHLYKFVLDSSKRDK